MDYLLARVDRLSDAWVCHPADFPAERGLSPYLRPSVIRWLKFRSPSLPPTYLPPSLHLPSSSSPFLPPSLSSDHGVRTLKDALVPAIRIARDGWPMYDWLSRQTKTFIKIRPDILEYPALEEIFKMMLNEKRDDVR